jgi:hypothetical protein
MHNEKLHGLYQPRDIIMAIKDIEVQKQFKKKER